MTTKNSNRSSNSIVCEFFNGPKSRTFRYAVCLIYGLMMWSVWAETSAAQETEAMLYSGKITALTSDSLDTVRFYAGFQGQGIFMSEDGEEWEKLSESPVGATIYAMACSEQGTLVVVGDKGAAVRQDDEWRMINRQITYDVCFSKSGTEKLYIGGHYGLLASENLGESWTNLTSNLSPRGTIVNCIETAGATGSKIFIGTKGDGLYVSGNGGITWRHVDAVGLNYIRDITSSPVDPDRILVLAHDEYRQWLINSVRTYLSVDGGSSWTYGDDWAVLSSADYDDEDPEKCYVATLYGGLYASTNGGETFSKNSPGILSLRVHSVLSRNGVVLAGTDDGLYSRDPQTGLFLKVDIPAGCVNDICFHPVNSDIAVAALTGGGVYISDDKGITWTPAVYGIDRRRIDVVAVEFSSDGSRLFASPKGDGVVISDNLGDSWRTATLQGGCGWYNIRDFFMQLEYPGYGYAAGFSDGLFQTSDKGETWQHMASSPEKACSYIAVNPSDSSNILYGTYCSELYRSTDYGESWNKIALPGTCAYKPVFEIKFHPQTANLVFLAAESGVFRSWNAGDDWEKCITGLTGSTPFRLAFSQDGSRLYAAVQNAGIFVSRNKGDNFELVSDQFEDQFIKALAVDPDDPDRILVGTAGAGIKIIVN